MGLIAYFKVLLSRFRKRIFCQSAFWVLIFFQVCIAFSQPDHIYFDHITTQEGLSQNDVNCILQDRRGFMWFGTNDGLNRYDGYAFKVFKPDSKNPFSIASNLIMALVEDEKGGIWIGTAGSGLIYFDTNTQRFYSLASPLAKNHIDVNPHVRQMMLDNLGRLWVSTQDGMFVLELGNFPDQENLHVRNLTKRFLPKELQTGFGGDIFQEENGTIWISNSEGLFRLSPGDSLGTFNQAENIPTYLDGSVPVVNSIVKDLAGYLVLSTSRGLLYQTKKGENGEPSFQEITSDSYADLIIDPHNRIWASGAQGLQCYTKGHPNSLPILSGSYRNDLGDSHSLNKNVLRTLFIDRNGLIWVGTNGGGINKFDPDKMAFRHFKKNLHKGSIGYDKIRSIFEDSERNLWIGTEGGGMDFLSAKVGAGDYESFQHIEENSHIFAIEEVQQGTAKWLYYGGQNNPSLYRIKIPQGSHLVDSSTMEIISPIDGAVFSLLNDQNGRLWVGTYNNGLYVIDLQTEGQSLAFENFQHDPQNPQSLSDNIIRSLLKDKEGNIWIGTGNGLNKLSASSIRQGQTKFISYKANPKDPSSLSHNYILPLFESSLGEIWIGTFGGGLNRYVPARDNLPAHFERFTEKEGLANDVVKGILEDKQGNLWISTNKGLSQFDPKSRTFKNYDPHDGLQSNEFGELACFNRHNGEMLFGGVNGFNSFFPGSFSDNSQLAEVVFTGFQVLNKAIGTGEKLNRNVILRQPITQTKHIQLAYNENSFSFEFAALHYSAPQKNQYQYTLEGFDDDWIVADAKRRIATYTNLGPGDYTMLVKASNNDGIWNESPSKITIHISPPIWRTWGAYIFYFILLVGLFAAIRRYTIIGIKEKHQLVLEHLEKEKSEELHQMKLQFFTNISHELRTPLTLILGPLDYLVKSGKHLDFQHRSQQYHLIQKNAHFLLRLVNQLLDFRKLDQGKMSLQVQQGDIVDFIGEITEPFQFIAQKKQITFLLPSQSQGIEAWFDPDIIEKVVYNLLSNAFKFTPDGGEISIEMDVMNQTPKGKTSQRNEWIELRIKDSGPGIPTEKKDRIFERFFTSAQADTSASQGTGIGLAFTKSLVELHHGEIWLESECGKGAHFVVSIPGWKKNYKKEEMGHSETYIGKNVYSDPATWLPSEIFVGQGNKENLQKVEAREVGLPLLLLIDDNQDIRTFMRQSLGSNFQIIEAADGVEGLELALEHLPDLIISDVMMPVMDGLSLCSRLRSNPRISHIPFILLTAKSSEENELEGLKNGADAYVRKPFNMDVLEAQIQNILNQRQELKTRFRRELLMEPEEVTIASVDEEFLKRAMEIVEEHMGDPDFNVETMVKEIGMSRSKLYLKLKALTDQSTSEFIRSVRLKRAVQLLEGGGLNVKEIMFMTGFNTASYFSKCFKKQFGVSPSEYLKRAVPADV